jgi:hypothetical protein
MLAVAGARAAPDHNVVKDYPETRGYIAGPGGTYIDTDGNSCPISGSEEREISHAGTVVPQSFSTNENKFVEILFSKKHVEIRQRTAWFEAQQVKAGRVEITNLAGGLDRGISHRDGLVQFLVLTAAPLHLGSGLLQLLALHFEFKFMKLKLVKQAMKVIGRLPRHAGRGSLYQIVFRNLSEVS